MTAESELMPGALEELLLALGVEGQHNVMIRNAAVVGGAIFIIGLIEIGTGDPLLAVGVLKGDDGGGAELLDRVLGVADGGDLHNDLTVAGLISVGLRVAQRIQALPQHGDGAVHALGQIAGLIGDLGLIGDFRAAHKVQAQHNAVLRAGDDRSDAVECGKQQRRSQSKDDQQCDHTFFHFSVSSISCERQVIF